MKPNWNTFVKNYRSFPELNLSLDLSHIEFSPEATASLEPLWEKAYKAMIDLEGGAIANPDENRQVGHYWLRNPDLAPDSEIKAEIVNTNSAIKKFCLDVHNGTIQGEGGAFENLLLVGIGGSALGPQLVDKALGDPSIHGLKPYFFDNTDPDGMALTLSRIGEDNLGKTLVVVISKSGGTKETRNGMLVAADAWSRKGLNFAKHAVAVTSEGSQLFKVASDNNWIDTFPMWDWVGGRTSVMSAVGLLPACLQGFDIDEFLLGARDADTLTRHPDWNRNPAAQMAFAWYKASNGAGAKDMVVLPYKDRLELFSKYLQQLVMESLGKELDLDGKVVEQGLTVYGNKGSTDQHAYVQQLREGVHNFFVTFIEILKSEQGQPVSVEDSITSGDYLAGFLQGTRTALAEKGRESITLTLPSLNTYYLGALIALYERVVGYYASMVNINAYHQPGVEAGKKAAGIVIEHIISVEKFLADHKGEMFHVEQMAQALGSEGNEEMIYRVCLHLAANREGLSEEISFAAPAESRFGFSG